MPTTEYEDLALPIRLVPRRRPTAAWAVFWLALAIFCFLMLERENPLATRHAGIATLIIAVAIGAALILLAKLLPRSPFFHLRLGFDGLRISRPFHYQHYTWSELSNFSVLDRLDQPWRRPRYVVAAFWSYQLSAAESGQREPDVALMIDANQGWDLATAIDASRRCEAYDIFWLEDPMPWYDERHGLRRLKSEVRIPIAAGETEYTPFGLRTMVAEGLVDYLIIDSTWAGGLTTWRKAAVMTELYQVPLAAHHDPQIHVHAVAASPTGFILESFADPTRDPLWFELFAERPTIVDGFMTVPDTPGLGLELRRDTLEKYGVKLQ